MKRKAAKNQVRILRDCRKIDLHDLRLKWWIYIEPRIMQLGEIDAKHQLCLQSRRFAADYERSFYKRADLQAKKGC